MRGKWVQVGGMGEGADDAVVGGDEQGVAAGDRARQDRRAENELVELVAGSRVERAQDHVGAADQTRSPMTIGELANDRAIDV